MGQQFEGTDPITDTSKLVVGQDVWVSSLAQGFIEGKVVNVTPEGADVQTAVPGIIHFNRKGDECNKTIHDLTFWRIDTLPVAKRRAMLERGRQNKLVVGQKVSMQSGDEFRAVTVEGVTEHYVRVALGERTGSVSDEYLDFRYDGSQCGLWGGADGWWSGPLCSNYVPWRLTEPSVVGPNPTVGAAS